MMSEAEKKSTTEPKPCSSGNRIGVGVAIGAAIGAAYGASSDNMAQSLAMGVALGTAIGAILDFQHRGRCKARASVTKREG